jgi:hypothetical protein
MIIHRALGGFGSLECDPNWGIIEPCFGVRDLTVSLGSCHLIFRGQRLLQSDRLRLVRNHEARERFVRLIRV